MHIEPLFDALIDAILFLELSDGNTVDRDAAVESLEVIAAHLQRLDRAEQTRLVSHIRRCAQQCDSEPHRKALLNLKDGLGLIDG